MQPRSLHSQLSITKYLTFYFTKMRCTESSFQCLSLKIIPLLIISSLSMAKSYDINSFDTPSLLELYNPVKESAIGFSWFYYYSGYPEIKNKYIHTRLTCLLGLNDTF